MLLAYVAPVFEIGLQELPLPGCVCQEILVDVVVFLVENQLWVVQLSSEDKVVIDRDL